MRPEDLLEALRKRPFAPFRIHLTDGSYFDIVHPEAILVLRSRAIIALRSDAGSEVPDRTEQIALLHIVRTSEIPVDGRQPAAGTTG